MISGHHKGSDTAALKRQGESIYQQHSVIASQNHCPYPQTLAVAWRNGELCSLSLCGERQEDQESLSHLVPLVDRNQGGVQLNPGALCMLAFTQALQRVF